MRKHNNKIDVLFVNPPSPDNLIYIRDINRHGRSSWERMIWPQTNLAILASMVNKLGLSADVIDCIAENISWDEYKKILEIVQPKYCFSNLISVTFHNDCAALYLSKKISNSVTVGMGPHLTADPISSIKEVKGLDYIICNEAENTLFELIQNLEKSNEPKLTDLLKINGICFIPKNVCKNENSQNPIQTEKRPFIKNLDSLPLPRHDLLPLDKYWAPILGNYTFIETSRGCPYKCIFCRQGIMYDWKYRIRSGESLFNEVMLLNKQGIKHIMFHADTFTVNEKVVIDLCDRLIEAGTPVKWACNGHAKTLSEKPHLLKKMKEAGCWMIAIGIESGDDGVLEKAKKSTNVKMITKAVEEIARQKIEVWGYFIIGLPGETLKTIQKTIDLSLKLPLSIAKFDIGAPYPGTEFYDYVTKNNLIRLNNETAEDYDQNASAIVSYDDLSAEQIKKWTSKATLKFFLRPKIIFYILKKVVNFKTLFTLCLIVRDRYILHSNKNVSLKRKNVGLEQMKTSI